MAFDADQVGEALGAGRTLAPAAVGSQVLLMSAISIVTIFAFNVLRPKNKIIYEPKVKYHTGEKAPPKMANSHFGWLPPLIHTKEPELLDKVGLDAVTFLRFLRLMRWLFMGTAALTCGVLMPINVLYNLTYVDFRSRDVLSMLTIRDVKGHRLYAHVAVSYLVTLFVAALVYYHWREMVRLRHAWFRSPEYMHSFYARTLMIMHVPKKYQSDAGLQTILNSVKMPYPATAVHIGRKVGQLPELIEYHNHTVRELEDVLVRYLKGGRIGRKRPSIQVGGCCGCGGKRRDAIDFYTAKLKRTEDAVEEYRRKIDSRKAESYGFASLAAVPYAHIVARLLTGKHPKGADITLAPNPKDIIWENMNKSDFVISRNRLVGWWWLSVLCFFSLIPLFLVAILANLDAFRTTGYVKFLDSWSNDSPITFAVISGVLPPAVAGFFTYFLPRIMRWLSQYMGALTHARLDRAVIARYFAFLVISQLIVFTLIGVLFNSVAEIVIQAGKGKTLHTILKSLNQLPGTIHKTYINQASFWLKWLPMRGFLVIFDLAQILNLLWISFKTRMFGRTPRDIREWTQPSDFEYAVYYSNLLFVAAVGFLFAPLAPLVAFATAIVFWLSSWVYKYQLMFVFVTRVETGGRLWNIVINRLLFCVFLMQLLMVLTIGLQDNFHSLKWLSTIPPIVFLICFKYFLKRKFDRQFRYYIPTQTEVQEACIHSARADVKGHRLENRFGHPSLHSELFTPLLHAKMTPLLSQVYNGKINNGNAKLNEYGGQPTAVQVVEGIRFAGVEQRDLEYDPILYQRDRGELDWERQSLGSTTISGSDATLSLYTKSVYTPGLSYTDYERYLTSGPSASSPEVLGASPFITPQQTAYFEQRSVSAAYPGTPLTLAAANFSEPAVAPMEPPLVGIGTASWHASQVPYSAVSDGQYLQRHQFALQHPQNFYPPHDSQYQSPSQPHPSQQYPSQGIPPSGTSGGAWT